MHNACYPLTNIRHLPFEYIDTLAVSCFWARNAIQRCQQNQFNFQSCQQSLEMQLKVLCQAYLRIAAGHGNCEAGKLSDDMQYLILYTYGLLKTTCLSPVI